MEGCWWYFVVCYISVDADRRCAHCQVCGFKGLEMFKKSQVLNKIQRVCIHSYLPLCFHAFVFRFSVKWG